MKKSLLIFILLLTSISAFSQIDSISFGVSIQASNNTLMLANGNVQTNVGRKSYGKDATGYKSNVSFGIFSTIYYRDKKNIGLEFIYNTCNSKDISSLEYTTINFATYLNYNLVSIHEDFFVDAGFGFGFIVESPSFRPENQHNVDVFLKLGCSYEIEKGIFLELGGFPSVTEVSKNYLTRRRYYFGVKISLDSIL